MTAETSPLPWQADEFAFTVRAADGSIIVRMLVSDRNDNEVKRIADAAMIVRAVNNHEAVIGALRDTIEDPSLAFADAPCSMIRARELLKKIEEK